ncbi:hypothetical protein V6615_12175 [Oscillospiraceae bacterium PP1C4]
MQLILSLAILVVFFWLTFRLAKIVSNFDINKAMDGQRPKGLEETEFMRYLSVYTDMFRTLNIRSLASVSTDLFYHSTENLIRLLTRLGLRREVSVQTGSNISEITDMNVIGKVAWITQEIGCGYRERLIDSVSGQMLEEKHYPISKFVISLNKNPLRQQSDPTYCTGCGSELHTNGEIFICNNCGATYHSDSYDWVINNAYAVPPPLQNPITLMSGVMGLFIFAAPIVSLISLFASGLLTVASVLNIVAFIGTIGYFVFAFWYYGALLKLQKHDKLCSMFRVMNRAEFLLYQFINCRGDNPARMRQFMDTGAYESWMRADSMQSGCHIVDYQLSNVCLFTDFHVANGRQHLRAKLPLTLCVFDERSRRLIKIKRTVNMVMYRNQNTRYQNHLSSEVFVCKGCGMPVNMTSDGKCRFCGTRYDLADYDWIIEWMDNSLYI